MWEAWGDLPEDRFGSMYESTTTRQSGGQSTEARFISTYSRINCLSEFSPRGPPPTHPPLACRPQA
jgi:hypothetical protein